MPTEPGRYFYRDRKGGYYGLCLVAWSRGFAHGDYLAQPELKPHATCIMGNDGERHFGENSDHPNWSYGMNPDRETLEFWSEPLVTPDFPDLPGRPPDIAPEVIKKEKAKSVAQAKTNKKRQREQAALRKKAVAQAVRLGADLFQCEGCDSVMGGAETVLGKMRGCPHCSTEFVEGDEGRNCPDCNRPFSSLVEEKQTCEDCRSGGELPDLTFVVKAGAVQ